MHKLSVVALAALVGCRDRAPTPAAAPTSAAIRGEIPVTTTVPAAGAAFERGRDLVENSRVPEGSAELQRAVELDAKLALAHAWLAKVTPGPDGQRHDEEAVKLAASLPEPEKVMVEALVARHRGEYERSRALETKLAELAPHDWRVQLLIGQRAFDERRWDQAVAALRHATELNPAAGEPYNMLGYALAFQGKLDEAEAALRTYAAKKPGEPNPIDSLAEIELMANKLDAAEATFARAAAAAPSFHFGWLGVAQTRFLRGDWAGGQAALAKARAAAPRPQEKIDVDVTSAYAQLAEGKAADALKTLGGAEAEAEKGKLPWLAFLPLERAVVLGEMGRFPEALAQLGEAAARGEKSGLSGGALNMLRRMELSWRAWTLARMKRSDEAKQAEARYEEEARVEPGNPSAQNGLRFARGAVAWSAGDFKAAAVEWDGCERDEPYCQWLAVQAHEKDGDTAGAAKAKEELLRQPMRNAMYTYVRARLAAKK